MGGDRALDVSRVGALDAALHERAGVLSQRQHPGEHGIVDCRPLRAIPRVARQRGFRVLAPPQGAIGARNGVVGGGELGVERDGPFQVPHGVGVASLAGGNGAEAELDRRGAGGVAEPLEHAAAVLEIAGPGRVSASVTLPQ